MTPQEALSTDAMHGEEVLHQVLGEYTWAKSQELKIKIKIEAIVNTHKTP